MFFNPSANIFLLVVRKSEFVHKGSHRGDFKAQDFLMADSLNVLIWLYISFYSLPEILVTNSNTCVPANDVSTVTLYFKNRYF